MKIDMKVKNEGKMYYWTECYLYLVYKLTNINRLTSKKMIDLEFFRSPQKKASSFWVATHTHLVPDTGVALDGFVFHANLYKQYNLKDYIEVAEQIKRENYDGDKRTPNRELILKNIFENNFNFQDFLDMPITKASIYEWFEFKTELPKETSSKLKNYLETYIGKYINGELGVIAENVQLFSKQKKELIHGLHELSESYGNQFIINEENAFTLGGGNLSFIHDIVAFEYLGLIEIEELSILDYEQSPLTQKEKYVAKIKILPKFQAEYTENTQNNVNKITLEYDLAQIKEILTDLVENQEKNIEVIKSNLERRFTALSENRNPKNFHSHFGDFVNYLGRTKIVADIIIKLALNNKIQKDDFVNLVIEFIISTITEGRIYYPLFMAGKANEKFNLKNELVAFFENEKKEGLKFFVPNEIFNLPISDDLSFITKLYNDIMEELSGSNFKKIVNKREDTPLSIGQNEAIYISGKADPLIEKTGNKAYWFIRACIEKSNADLTIDITAIYTYLLQNNEYLQKRYKIKPNLDIDGQWDLIHQTYHNTKRGYFSEIKRYLIKNSKQLKNLQWLENKKS